MLAIRLLLRCAQMAGRPGRPQACSVLRCAVLAWATLCPLAASGRLLARKPAAPTAAGANASVAAPLKGDSQRQPNLELVVAVYCGDGFMWLRDVDCKSVDVYLYNKCDSKLRPEGKIPKKLPSCVRLEHLPNKGREGATHFHHLVTHYQRLQAESSKSGGIVFMQGTAHWGYGDSNSKMTLALEYADKWVKAGVGFTPLSAASCSNKYPFIPEPGLVVNLASFLMQESVKFNWMASYKGQFVVSKARAVRVPLWLYEYSRDFLLSEQSSKSFRGHSYERLWTVFFGCWEKYNASSFKNDFPACFDNCHSSEECGPNRKVPFEGHDSPPMTEQQFESKMLVRADGQDENLLPNNCRGADLVRTSDRELPSFANHAVSLLSEQAMASRARRIEAWRSVQMLAAALDELQGNATADA